MRAIKPSISASCRSTTLLGTCLGVVATHGCQSLTRMSVELVYRSCQHLELDLVTFVMICVNYAVAVHKLKTWQGKATGLLSTNMELARGSFRSGSMLVHEYLKGRHEYQYFTPMTQFGIYAPRKPINGLRPRSSSLRSP